MWMMERTHMPPVEAIVEPAVAKTSPVEPPVEPPMEPARSTARQGDGGRPHNEEQDHDQHPDAFRHRLSPFTEQTQSCHVVCSQRQNIVLTLYRRLYRTISWVA